MNENKTAFSLSGVEVRVGLTVALCLLACHGIGLLGYTVQALAACTAGVMCIQEAGSVSRKAGLTRLLGVLCGGIVGVLVVLLDNWIGNPLIFYCLAGVGIVANMLLCKAVKLPPVQARVSCMTVLLVVLVLGGNARISYAVGRLVGTLVGALVAWLVSAACEKLFVKK